MLGRALLPWLLLSLLGSGFYLAQQEFAGRTYCVDHSFTLTRGATYNAACLTVPGRPPLTQRHSRMEELLSVLDG
ncbi:hypothetical protein GCM10022215_44130 [Nocardioides fonticola]|uniref:Uncharacterized protein n=1 Tax=Nocardioides fonticola TaxID=450363 RepID=A0ABP7Y4H8_9ACTN